MPQTNAHHCHGPNGSKWAFILRKKPKSEGISYQGYNLFQVPSLMPLNSLTRNQPLTLASDLQPPTDGESLNLDDGGTGK